MLFELYDENLVFYVENYDNAYVYFCNEKLCLLYTNEKLLTLKRYVNV